MSFRRLANLSLARPSAKRSKIYLAIVASLQLMVATRGYSAPDVKNVEFGGEVEELDGNTLNVKQRDQYMLINWNSFDVENGETVHFHQGNNQFALNNILGGSASRIDGHIKADGHVLFINPQGIVFEKNAVIHVGGLLASGLEINLDEVLSGTVTFSSENGSGSVINKGKIEAQNGDIILLGSSVSNSNSISATKGSVTLMAGSAAVLTIDDGKIGIQLTEAALNGTGVVNSSDITAKREILLTASVQGDLLSYAVNNGDLPRSSSVLVHEDGSFTLGASGDVINQGSLKTTLNTADSSISLIGTRVDTSGTITSEGDISLHSGSSVDISGSISAGKLTVTAGQSGCEAGCAGSIANIDVKSHASITATDSIAILAADNVSLRGDIGSDTSHQAQLTVRAGNSIEISGAVHASSSTTDEPAVLLSAGDEALQAWRSVSTANDSSSSSGTLPPASIMVSNSINSHGGDIHLKAFYDSDLAESTGNGSAYGMVKLDGSIETFGGNLKVGSLDNRVGSFISTRTLRTAGDDKGGSITVYSENEVEVNSASFGGLDQYRDATVGFLELDSLRGDIRLEGDYEYNSSNGNAGGVINVTAHNGSIELVNFTADDGEQGKSRLDIDLTAQKDIDVQIGNGGATAWLNGGNFAATSADGEISFHGNELMTEGGDVTLTGRNLFLSGGFDTSGGAFSRDGGAVTLNGDVSLRSNLSLIAGSSDPTSPRERGAIAFNGTVGSDAPDYALNIVAGAVDFQGEVKGLRELTIDATGSVQTAINEAGRHDISVVDKLFVEAASFSSGNIKAAGGNVEIDVGRGTLSTGDIDTSGSSGSSGGSIALKGGDITVESLISDAGSPELAGESELEAGGITISAQVGEDQPASVYIGGDISSKSGNGTQRQASIKRDGSCTACISQVTFGSSTFVNGNVALTGFGGSDRIAVSGASAKWTIGEGTRQIESREHESSGLITFSSFGELVGSNKSDLFEIQHLPTSGLTIKGSADGLSSDPDVLQGPSSEEGNYEWYITGRNEGSLKKEGAPSGGVVFEGISHLKGGIGSDRFVFDSEGAVENIDGGEGSAELQVLTGTNAWSLSSNGVVSISRRDDSLEAHTYLVEGTRINSLIGSDSDSLKGPQETTSNIWIVKGINSGGLSFGNSQLDFAGMTTLVGGEGADDFIIEEGGITGTLDGGGGENTITGKSVATTWRISGIGTGSLSFNDATYVNEFTNIQKIIAATDSDTLADESVIDQLNRRQWILTGDGSGSLSALSSDPQNNIQLIAFEGMKNLHGGIGTTDELYGPDTSSTWVINGAGSGYVESEQNRVSFEGMEVLLGGSEDDIFEIHLGGSISGHIDGGEGDNKLDISRVSAESNYAVEIGNSSSSRDLSAINIDEIVGGGQATLVIAAGDNEWRITGQNEGQLNEKVVFTGVANLFGGSGTDEFKFEGDNASLTGSIDGGAGNNTITGRDSATHWTVTGRHEGNLKNEGGEQLGSFVNIQNVIAGSSNDTLSGLDIASQWEVNSPGSGQIKAQLEGDPEPLTVIAFQGMKNLNGSGEDLLWADTDYNLIWTISAQNTGSISSSDGDEYIGTFSGMKHLQSGSGDDEFVFATNRALISGTMDGGGGANRLVGRSSNTDWHLGLDADQMNSGQAKSGGEAYATFVNMHYLQGSAAHTNRLFGGRQVNYWTTTGDGSGAIKNGSGANGDEKEIRFSGMSSLHGNELEDVFTITSGHISRMVDGGSGNDSIFLTVAGDASGSLELQNIETITLDGGSDSFVASHLFSTVQNRGTLTYTNGENAYRVNYSDGDSILDSVVAATLNIRSRDSADEIIINGDNTYEIGGHLTTVEFDRKKNLAFLTKQEDTIRLQGSITVDGALIFNNAALEYQSGLLTAHELYLDRTTQVGSETDRLRTNVDHVFFAGTRGPVYINEQGNLNIAEAAIGGVVDIALEGNLSSSAAIFSSHDFSVFSDGAINLTHNNRLEGNVSFRAWGDVSFKNLEATNFTRLAGASANIDSRGDISSSEGIEIQGLAVFRSAGDVLLDHGDNKFQEIRIDEAGSVSIRSNRDYKVSGIKSSGPVNIYSGSTLGLSGSLKTPGHIKIEAAGDITQWGQLEGEIIKLTSGGNITMDRNARSRASATISYLGENISLGQLTAATVTVDSSGAISSTNSDVVNITADRLFLSAEYGIGERSALSTLVDDIFLVNNVGNSHIVNGKTVRITGLYSNGDIRFRNTVGDVYLDPQAGKSYLRYHSDARFSGGLVDANYEIGTLTFDLGHGSLLTTTLPDSNYPILVARNMWLTTPRGALGQPLYPLMVYVKDNLILVSSRPSWIRYAFESPPVNIDDSGTISGDLADLISAGNEQLVEIEELTNIDPAVFTNVRNYAYDDIAIRLPDDQLYDVEDE